MSKVETYERGRIQILSRIIQTSTVKLYGSDPRALSDGPILKGFIDAKPEPGDLVRIEYARPTKWYLSWFVEHIGSEDYLLESIEDRAQCKWSNCCLSVYDRKIVQDNPQFKYSDRQFAFWDRWQKPDGRKEPYAVMPVMPHFEGQRVRLATRSRFNRDARALQEMWFENWEKVTKNQMREFYLSVVESLKSSDRATLPTDGNEP
jgi:hypothetical protein